MVETWESSTSSALGDAKQSRPQFVKICSARVVSNAACVSGRGEGQGVKEGVKEVEKEVGEGMRWGEQGQDGENHDSTRMGEG